MTMVAKTIPDEFCHETLHFVIIEMLHALLAIIRALTHWPLGEFNIILQK